MFSDKDEVSEEEQAEDELEEDELEEDTLEEDELEENELEEDEVDLEVAHLFNTPPAAAPPPPLRATERPRRPVLRRGRRPSSEGGSPLAGGLPYTGRFFCEYN